MWHRECECSIHVQQPRGLGLGGKVLALARPPRPRLFSQGQGQDQDLDKVSLTILEAKARPQGQQDCIVGLLGYELEVTQTTDYYLVLFSVRLLTTLPKSYWSDLHENFTYHRCTVWVKKGSPPKKNFLQYFHLGQVYFCEILQIYCQYISTNAYQFWPI